MKTIFTNIKYLAILFALILSVNTVDAQIGIDNEKNRFLSGVLQW